MTYCPQSPGELLVRARYAGRFGLSDRGCPRFFDLVARSAHGRLGVVGRRRAIQFSSPAWLNEQFGPHIADNLGWEKLKPGDKTVCFPLDQKTEVNGNRSSSGFPCANIGGVSADGLGQGTRSSAFAIEVSFQVHGSQYSESLETCNSESHIPLSSVLL